METTDVAALVRSTLSSAFHATTAFALTAGFAALSNGAGERAWRLRLQELHAHIIDDERLGDRW
jgi:hypothetical protein